MSTKTAVISRIFAVFLLFCLVEVKLAIPTASASAADFIPLRTDINGDGVVNIVDIAIILQSARNSGWVPRCDLNDDGVVNMIDIVIVAKDYRISTRANIASGTWSILNGSLEGFSDAEGLIYTRDVMWKDCTLTAKVKIAADSFSTEAAFCICLVDSGNFYWAGLGSWGHRVSISRIASNVPEELIFSGDRADVVKDVWYNVSIKISDDTIMLYVNDLLELTVNDSTFTSGAVGIRTWNSHVIVDYVTVSGRIVPPQNVAAHDVLYADGVNLRVPSGEEVVLVGAQYDYNTLRREIWFGIDDVQKMKAYGGSVVELNALLFANMMPERGVIDQSWIDRLDEWVDWCEQEQIYCIISFASFTYKRWGTEAPVWLLEGKYPHPWDKNVWNQAAIDFWDIDNPLQDNNRQSFVDAWKFLADRYKNNRYVLFGIMNEPFCTNHLVTSQNAEHLSIMYARFIERIIDAIRSTGAKQLIFVDKPYVWFRTNHFEPVNRDGIVWEDHLYVGPDFDISQWKAMLNEYVQRYVYTFNKPFYVGEYGPYPFSEYDGGLSDWRTILKEQVTFLKSIPVCGYSWHEYPWLEGEYYDYVYNYLTSEESDYILQTIYG